jgi:hypothetical protein
MVNDTISIKHICEEVYKTLLQDKVFIVSLIFSDGNKIFVDKDTLCCIKYFEYILKDCATLENVIIEIPLNGILDNPIVMKEVIYFVDNGTCVEKIDCNFLYQLALINDYLLEVSVENKITNNKKLCSFDIQHMIYNILVVAKLEKGNKILYDYIRSVTINMLYSIDKYDRECFDTMFHLYNLYKIKIDKYLIPDRVINHNSGFIGSLLHTALNSNDKIRVSSIIAKLDADLENVDL